MDWLDLAQNRGKWRVLEETAGSLMVQLNARILLTNHGKIRF